MNSIKFILILFFFKLNVSFAQERAIPECVQNQINDSLELKRKEIKLIKEFLIKGRYLYVFERFEKPQKSSSSYKKPSSTIYYDSICNVATTLTIGGVVGIKATNGFNNIDFQEGKQTRIIWKSKEFKN